jgi:hydrogenase expression/formation protein HypE
MAPAPTRARDHSPAGSDWSPEVTNLGDILPPGKLPGDLLGRLLERHSIHDERVLIGPGMGRDAAAIQFGKTALVVKTDPITFPTERSALHLVHVNANDLACQGAVPRWLLVTALLPHGSTTAESAASMFADLNAAAAQIGVSVIGGHTEITIGLDRPILVGTMLGEVAVDRLIDPRHAAPGDRLLMTKSAGIEGTVVLADEMRSLLVSRGVSGDMIDAAAAMIEDPGISVLAEAQALCAVDAVDALHDPTEGGIAAAVRELALASGCGVMISRDAIPIAPETVAIAAALNIDPLGMLASGSLLAAVPRECMEAAEDALIAAGIPYAWIGKLTPPEAGMRVRTGMAESALPEFAVDEVARVLAG